MKSVALPAASVNCTFTDLHTHTQIWERFEPRLPLQHVFSDHWLTSTGHTVVDKQ